ncbi:MAG: C4-type zinc ribbon domain-containing protein [Bacteroidales bacterium]|jgi:predicted  nucleic acid-binding Zn-ribbon protein|nr:C4-type zinc ribbon domain-containing protein [Bacteroidales bacterium]
MAKTKKEEIEEVSVEKKLKALYNLQQIDTQIDKIKIVRGELPLEVEDLEDEIAGLQTRIDNFQQDVENLKTTITEKEDLIKSCQSMIKKYEEQQMNVRNNREYDSLSKEVEFQKLEIQLAEKLIKESKFKIENLDADITDANERLNDKNLDLDAKKAELNDIVKETEKDEKDMIKKSKENEKFIEERLLTAYKRIRENARNGLAVVQIERDACGGCFNKIPPQHQLDIKMHKKIIVCEYCGRILVDNEAPVEDN